MDKKSPEVMVPKFVRRERLGVNHDGPNVLMHIEGKTVGMPWDVAMQLAQVISSHAVEARQHDPAFQQQLLNQIEEKRNGGRRH